MFSLNVILLHSMLANHNECIIRISFYVVHLVVFVNDTNTFTHSSTVQVHEVLFYILVLIIVDIGVFTEMLLALHDL